MSDSVAGLPEHGDVTRLLRSWRQGSGEAHDALWSLVYGELQGLARSVLRARRSSAAPRPTSLVHQAYLRLLSADVDWTDRRHFFAVAARAMRFILADEARRQLSAKRGEGAVEALEELRDEVGDPWVRRPEEVLSVHGALERLGKIRPRYERLVELRYFAGLSVAETAEVLGVTQRTVVRDWKAAKSWLHGELAQVQEVSVRP